MRRAAQRPGGGRPRPRRRLRLGRLAAALLLLAGLAGSASPATGQTGLRAVPRPRLEGVEAAIREQLQAEHAKLDALLAAPDPPPGELAAAFGLLGRLYLLFDLAEPALACLANAADLAPGDPRWPYYLGYLQQSRGDLDAAAASFRRSLERAPRQLAAWVRLGQVELAGGRAQEAARAFERALDLDEDSAAAHAGLAQLAAAAGRLEAAAGHYEAALAAQPEASALRYPLAVAYRRLDRLEEARRQLERRGEQPPAFPDPWLEQLPGLTGSASPHLVAAGKAMADGRMEEALESYRQALAAAPDNPLAHRGHGEALARAGRMEEAVAAYRRAVEISPGDAVAHHDLGVLLLSFGRLDEAARALETAVGLALDLAPAHASLAAVHGRQGRQDLAVSALDRYLALRPGDREARRRRAAALVDLERAPEAAGELRQLVGTDPTDLASRYQLGRALAAAGGGEAEEDEAHRQFAEVAAAAAGGRPALAALAHIELARLERRSGAGDELSHLEAAVELAPELVEAHAELGAALLAHGRPEEAGAAFEQALALDPLAAPAHLGRARARLAAGGCPAALPALEESLARLPGNGDLAHLLARLLAACPQEAHRDGRRALELATAVFQARPTVDHAETVAMALAELGRFAEAVVFQQQAVAEAQRQGAPPAALAAARERLAAYRRGEPWRAP